MPQIPEFDPQVDVHLAQPGYTSPGAMALPGEAIARGAQEIGAPLEEFNRRYQDARRGAELSNLMATAGQRLNDSYFKNSRTPDRVAAGDAFAADSQAIYKDMSGKINDPLLKQHFDMSFQAESVGRQLETERTAFGYETSKRVGELNSNLLTFAQNAASADDPLLRAKIIDEGTKAIAGAASGGWIEGNAAEELRQHFVSQINQVHVEQLIDHAIQSGNPKDSAAVSAMLGDPKNFEGLNPQERESLSFRVDRLNDRLENRAIARQAHDDAIAARNFTRAQGHNEAMILGGVWAGKSIDPAVLEKLMDTGQISAGGGEAIHSAMEKRTAGSDDPVTTVALWHNIDSGHATVDDVYDAVKAGKLKGETAATMTRELDAGTTPAAKDALDVFKRAVTGNASGTAGFGGGAQAALAEGLGAFHQRIGAGENPSQVLAELVPHYAPSMTTPSFLAQPRFGEPASTKDVFAIGAATFKAHQARQIDDTAYASQVELLNDYRRWFAAKDEMARAQAAAAAKRAATAPKGNTQ